jgi:small subunit ribosomal protein S16
LFPPVPLRHGGSGRQHSLTLGLLSEGPRKSKAGKETSSVLMIRLSRVGARKQPHYRVVVIEKERARNGRPVEIVGTYNPRTTPASVELKRERIDYWRSKGAQVSARVGKILEFAQSAPAAPVAS